MELRTPRLVLKPWSPSDVDALHAFFAEPGVRRYLCDGEIVERGQVEAQVVDSEQRFAAGAPGLWVATAGTALVAIGGFLPVDADEGLRLELVFAVSDAKIRQGYGEEVGRAAIGAGRALGLREIHAGTDAPNTASQRLLERLGFVRAGAAPGPRWEQLRYVLALEGARSDAPV